MSSGESGSQQLQLLFSRASIPARLRIILKENINTDKNYKYTEVVEEISLALVQSKLGGMTLRELHLQANSGTNEISLQESKDKTSNKTQHDIRTL